LSGGLKQTEIAIYHGAHFVAVVEVSVEIHATVFRSPLVDINRGAPLRESPPRPFNSARHGLAAARANNGEAQYDLGLAYLNGDGAPQDFVEAYYRSTI